MTIEQLMASGQYNVIDNRVEQKRSLLGTAGDDLMIAGARSVIMRGMGGNDCLIGGSSNDILFGGAGDDQIFGAGGNDRLEGNSGHNRIDGGSGTDSCNNAGSLNSEG
jgi:Ca2+-binding RTX toxin-like protein